MIVLAMALVRAAEAADHAQIADILNEALAEGHSTDVEGSALLVATMGGAVAGSAQLTPYSRHARHAGVAAGSVYVRPSQRGRGLGEALAAALIKEAERAGLHKIVAERFADDEASRRLVARHGFREVGVHLRHAELGGEWRDVVLVERLLSSAARSAARTARTAPASGTRRRPRSPHP